MYDRLHTGFTLFNPLSKCWFALFFAALCLSITHFKYKSVPTILKWWIFILHNKKKILKGRCLLCWCNILLHQSLASDWEQWRLHIWPLCHRLRVENLLFGFLCKWLIFCEWKSKIAIFLRESLSCSFLRSDVIKLLTVALQSEQFWAKELRLNVRKSEFPTLHQLEDTNCKFVCMPGSTLFYFVHLPALTSTSANVSVLRTVLLSWMRRYWPTTPGWFPMVYLLPRTPGSLSQPKKVSPKIYNLQYAQ